MKTHYVKDIRVLSAFQQTIRAMQILILVLRVLAVVLTPVNFLFTQWKTLLRVLLPEPALPRVPVLLQPVPVREPRRSELRLPTPFLLLLQTACR